MKYECWYDDLVWDIATWFQIFVWDVIAEFTLYEIWRLTLRYCMRYDYWVYEIKNLTNVWDMITARLHTSSPFFVIIWGRFVLPTYFWTISRVCSKTCHVLYKSEHVIKIKVWTFISIQTVSHKRNRIFIFFILFWHHELYE